MRKLMNANQLLKRLQDLENKYDINSVDLENCTLELALICEEASKMNGPFFIEPDYRKAREIYRKLYDIVCTSDFSYVSSLRQTI